MLTLAYTTGDAPLAIRRIAPSDGCPDLDNDRDGVPDAFDKCPDEPGARTGKPDDDGCPAAPALPVAPGSALQAAQLTFDNGRASLAAGKYREACEQSQQRELARSDSNPGRRARAGQLAAALAGRVAKLRLVLARPLDGARVSLNGVYANALLGIEAPVDVGSYDTRTVTVVIDLQKIPGTSP